MKTSIKNLSLLASAALLTFSSLSAVSTDPVGYVTIDIQPGTGADKNTNIVSIPLLPTTETITGLSSGVITGATSNSIQVTDAAWEAGELSVGASPYLLRITSGDAEGLTLPISTVSLNTSTELFLDTTFSGRTLDLTSVGISVGDDTFAIIPADTLSSLFGSPATTGITGGTSAANADTVIVFNNGWNVYFYSNTKDEWVKSQFGFPSAGDLILHPDYALIYERLGVDELGFIITGNVPTTARSVSINDSGITFLAGGWPIETTLVESGIQDLEGWVSGANASLADQVIVRSASGWNTFFYNGTNWKKSTFGFPVSDSEVLGLGEGLIINRLGSGNGLSQLIQNLPYTL